MENPIKMDDLGGKTTPIFGSTPIYYTQLVAILDPWLKIRSGSFPFSHHCHLSSLASSCLHLYMVHTGFSLEVKSMYIEHRFYTTLYKDIVYLSILCENGKNKVTLNNLVYIYITWMYRYTSPPPYDAVRSNKNFNPTSFPGAPFRWTRSGSPEIISLSRTMDFKQRGARKKTDELTLLAFLQELRAWGVFSWFSLIIFIFHTCILNIYTKTYYIYMKDKFYNWINFFLCVYMLLQDALAEKVKECFFIGCFKRMFQTTPREGRNISRRTSRQENQFSCINKPKLERMKRGGLFLTQMHYPLHVAARLGDSDVASRRKPWKNWGEPGFECHHQKYVTWHLHILHELSTNFWTSWSLMLNN